MGWRRARERNGAAALLVLVALGGAACQERLDHQVLTRAGYGPDPWSRQRLEALGFRAYIDEQLHPESIPDPVWDGMRADFPVLRLSYRELYEQYGGNEVREQLAEARMLRAIHTRRQLESVMIDFWLDHFNVFAGTGLAERAIAPYEQTAIAPHALGRFEDLLVAVATSAAMMAYLDNDGSRDGALNENYARELMELHTLGVDGPYSEDDVREVARCFTGWSTDRGASESASGFLYRPDWHDDGEKVVLGTTIPAGGGMEDGRSVLRLLARHPSTAEFVSRKLAHRFVSDRPKEPLVQRMAERWLASDGDLREVMRLLLNAPEFTLAPFGEPAKVKRPLVLLAGLARGLGASGDGMARRLVRDARDLGEELYMARPPTGYPEASHAWAGNETLLRRLNIFHATARGHHGLDFTPAGGDTPEAMLEAWIDRLFVRDVPEPTRDAALAYLAGLPAYVRNDPDRASRELLWALLASPELLTH